MYIHERENWTAFRWNDKDITLPLEEANRKRGLLFGRLDALGFDNKLTAMAENLTQDVVFSSEIEGISLNIDEVRSSVAQRLNIENVKATAPSHYVDSVVAVMLDTVRHYDQPLTKDKLCAWQAAFFPSGYSEGARIEVGRYRTAPERIVSGMLGREKVHYIAPEPERVEEEMRQFLSWFNSSEPVSCVVRSAIAHLWFVSIHPFEDGNGRLARILSDIMLARGDKSHYRFYNVSSEINKDKSHYYDLLERTQRGDGDITEWIAWYIRTVVNAIDEAQHTVNGILNKSFFWLKARNVPMTERQIRVLNFFLDGYEAKITTKTWAALGKCSPDTALRDIQSLERKFVLREDCPGAKRPSYSIVYDGWHNPTADFTDISIEHTPQGIFLNALHKGHTQVRERLLKLDAERYEQGDLPLPALLEKYCSYLRLQEGE